MTFTAWSIVFVSPASRAMSTTSARSFRVSSGFTIVQTFSSFPDKYSIFEDITSFLTGDRSEPFLLFLITSTPPPQDTHTQTHGPNATYTTYYRNSDNPPKEETITPKVSPHHHNPHTKHHRDTYGYR